MTSEIPERFLIIGAESIAGTVMSMPAVQRFRQEYPDASITLLVPPGLEPLWAMHAAPDEILLRQGRRKTIHMLRQLHFDRVYLFSGDFGSAWVGYKANISRRIGARGQWRRLLLTEIVHVGEGHRQFEYMNILGVHGDPELPKIQVPPESFLTLERKLCHLLDLGGTNREILQALENRLSVCLDPEFQELRGCAIPVVTLLPGTMTDWPVNHVVLLAKNLVCSANAVVLLGGTVNDSALCEDIASAAGPRVLSLAGKTTIPEWAAMMELSDCVVGAGSGGLHLASVVGTPAVGLYGDSSSEKESLLGNHVVVQKKSVAAISPAKVLLEAKNLLGISIA